MRKPSSITERLVVLAVVGILIAIVTPAQGQAIIPEGATIDQATLTVWSPEAYGATVNVHRITADWGEMSVTWFNFNASYDPVVAASFVANAGLNTADVTDLVQGWVNSDYPNFGILMEQSSDDLSWFHSSESADLGLRPQLEIWFTTISGETGYILIKRPGDLQDGVRDSFIQEMWINKNKGLSPMLLTGYNEGYEKQTLIRFDFSCEPGTGPGTGTLGYWKTHPEAWPVDVIEIGGVWLSKEDAIWWMWRPVQGDKTKTMFKSLVAAKLNVLIGNDDSCIASEIIAADDWMASHPVGSGVPGGGEHSPWRVGKPIHKMLNDYNNGRLGCADHRG